MSNDNTVAVFINAALTINNRQNFIEYVTETCNEIFTAMHSLKKLKIVITFHIRESNLHYALLLQ